MRKIKIFKLFPIIIILFFTFNYISIHHQIFDLSRQNNSDNNIQMQPKSSIEDWYEDCSDISDWNDIRGSPFETNFYDEFPDTLTSSLVSTSNCFTPDTLWWTDNSIGSLRNFGLYRSLPDNNWDELNLSSSIDFNPVSITNPYSFQGRMTLAIAGPNMEILFYVEIADGSGSIGNHETYHHAYYRESSSVGIIVLPIFYASDPIIYDGIVSIHVKTDTILVNTPLVTNAIDLSLNPATAFQRGVPTYVVLFGYRTDGFPLPTSFSFNSVEVSTRLFISEGDSLLLLTTGIISTLIINVLFIGKRKRKRNL